MGGSGEYSAVHTGSCVAGHGHRRKGPVGMVTARSELEELAESEESNASTGFFIEISAKEWPSREQMA